jgi:hypothetical protein
MMGAFTTQHFTKLKAAAWCPPLAVAILRFSTSTQTTVPIPSMST